MVPIVVLADHPGSPPPCQQPHNLIDVSVPPAYPLPSPPSPVLFPRFLDTIPASLACSLLSVPHFSACLLCVRENLEKSYQLLGEHFNGAPSHTTVPKRTDSPGKFRSRKIPTPSLHYVQACRPGKGTQRTHTLIPPPTARTPGTSKNITSHENFINITCVYITHTAPISSPRLIHPARPHILTTAHHRRQRVFLSGTIQTPSPEV